jgi:cytokinin dehydrogenase
MSPTMPGPRRWSDEEAAALAAVAGVSLRRDAATRDEASADFGHLARGDVWGVAAPRDAGELEKLVRFAAARGLPLTPRGRGYSQAGQSLAAGGVTLDCTRLDRLEPVEAARRLIRCEAGARWREVVAATLPHGLLPAVLPLNLDMSVGGLLSAGGIGANSHAFGPAIAHVVELDVVTATHGLVRCDRGTEPELFAAVLGGLGRCGVMLRATLALRPVRPRVRTFHLLYTSLDDWLADQRTLVRQQRADYLEGFCWAGAKGSRLEDGRRRPFTHWLYGLQIGIEHDDVTPEPAAATAAALAGLRHLQVIHVEDESLLSHVERYQPRFDGMRRSGAWAQRHPWLECLVPGDRVAQVLPAVLDRMPPSLGDGHRAVWVARDDLPAGLALPEARDAVCLAFLPPGVPPGESDEVVAALADADALLRAAGGKRYLSGWLGAMDEESWREHHGPRYAAWVSAKQRFDPESIFRSALFPGP